MLSNLRREWICSSIEIMGSGKAFAILGVAIL